MQIRENKKALSSLVQAGERARLLATADFITPADNEASVSGDSRPRKDSAYGTVNITEADTLVKEFSYNADNSPKKHQELHNYGNSNGYNKQIETGNVLYINKTKIVEGFTATINK